MDRNDSVPFDVESATERLTDAAAIVFEIVPQLWQADADVWAHAETEDEENFACRLDRNGDPIELAKALKVLRALAAEVATLVDAGAEPAWLKAERASR